jgi:hypothetical protein
MVQLLKPHTKKWFGAIARSNVWQAAVTLEIIQWARNKRVCSLCGKKPARDYRLTKHCFGHHLPATMRLCRECFATYCCIQGEEPLPMPA